ncbi:MAG: acetyl-CoA carboxylase biotin carboxyl carrier protein subunit [Bdellovibrionales bacterium]|nr:acetyl-CoA carboxylase biotin carboxyl carrier protein subunit [Bdellovibrionales bacterium]
MTKIKSEMAGTILEIKVKVGDPIKPGQEIVVLESMKMEVPIGASHSGIVTEIKKQVGDFVNEGETLIELS